MTYLAVERKVSASSHRQALLGNADVSTSMIYTHMLKVAAGGTASPLDRLDAAFV